MSALVIQFPRKTSSPPLALCDILEFDLPALIFDEPDTAHASGSIWTRARMYFSWFGIDVQRARGLHGLMLAWDWLQSRYGAPLRYATVQLKGVDAETAWAAVARRFPELSTLEVRYVRALVERDEGEARRLAVHLGIAARVRACAVQA